jgi:hypothetical protein
MKMKTQKIKKLWNKCSSIFNSVSVILSYNVLCFCFLERWC